MNALNPDSREYHISRATAHTAAESAAVAAREWDRADRETDLAILHLTQALALPASRPPRRFNR